VWRFLKVIGSLGSMAEDLRNFDCKGTIYLTN